MVFLEITVLGALTCFRNDSYRNGPQTVQKPQCRGACSWEKDLCFSPHCYKHLEGLGGVMYSGIAFQNRQASHLHENGKGDVSCLANSHSQEGGLATAVHPPVECGGCGGLGKCCFYLSYFLLYITIFEVFISSAIKETLYP